MTNIHSIFRENCRVRTIWICQGKKDNSTYFTTTFIHFDYKVLPLLIAEICLNNTFKFCMKNKELGFFNNVLFLELLKYAKKKKKMLKKYFYKNSIRSKKSYQCRQKAYIINKMFEDKIAIGCAYCTGKEQSVIKTSRASRYLCNLLY